MAPPAETLAQAEHGRVEQVQQAARDGGRRVRSALVQELIPSGPRSSETYTIRKERREAIADRAALEQVQEAARQLHERLFAGARRHIRTEWLFIVPHDVLHYLPFGAQHPEVPLGRLRPNGGSLMSGMRAALWGLLVAKLIGGWGVQWDIQWHLRIGRDSFWIAPHVMTYASVVLSVLLSFGILALTTVREPAPSSLRTTRFLGLRGTRGFHLALWGIMLTVLAAPIDDAWHRLFGVDVTLWSPPHLLGLLGSAVNTAACLLIAREVYRTGSRARQMALLLSGALLYATLHITLQPTIRIAYLHGGARFYAYIMLAALILPLALVATARLSDSRWAPLFLIALVVAIGTAGNQIARAGFAVLQPVSVIEEEIAKDPTSPIAVANIIARKNGTEPGRPVGASPFLAFIPACIMTLLDARQRPVAATVGYAATLFVVSGWQLARLPALESMVPGLEETLLALLVTLASAFVGGATARRLSDALEPAPLGRA